MNALMPCLVVAVLAYNAGAESAPPVDTNRMEFGSIPYLAVYKLSRLPASPVATNEILYSIASNSTNVHGKDIVLTIASKRGRIPIPLEESGGFTLPMSTELTTENPPIASNQPKGSLKIECWSEMRHLVPPKDGVIAYRDLVLPELMINAVSDIICAADAVTYPKMIYLRGATGGKIIIRAHAGQREITGDGSFYEIPINSSLMRENPDVILPKGGLRYVEGCGFTASKFLGRIENF